MEMKMTMLRENLDYEVAKKKCLQPLRSPSEAPPYHEHVNYPRLTKQVSCFLTSLMGQLHRRYSPFQRCCPVMCTLVLGHQLEPQVGLHTEQIKHNKLTLILGIEFRVHKDKT